MTNYIALNKKTKKDTGKEKYVRKKSISSKGDTGPEYPAEEIDVLKIVQSLPHYITANITANIITDGITKPNLLISYK